MRTGVIEEFATLWGRDAPPPDLFAFLEARGGAAVEDELALVLHDQRHRWGTDRPLRVEDYLARLPRLAGSPDGKLQLVLGEVFARRERGLPAGIDEFRARFGDLGDALGRRLDGLEAGEATLARSTCVAWAPGVESGMTATPAGAMPAAGERIGRYRLDRVLGEGAFGRVYLGFDDELGRRVAIKVPAPERFRRAADAESYLAEARMVAGLDHPNIVPVHDVGRAEAGSIFVVSKLIAGRTLKDLIREARPAPSAAAALVASVARALHHAHQRRLIHRDVKPGNILIEDETGTPYVADFGLAIREEEHPRAGLIAGTPAYMSPEQARGEGHRLDGRSDVFSLGVVFYELLTGSRPFLGFTAVEMLSEVVTRDPTPPRDVAGSIPPELERICLKALAKRASDRYPTMADLADDLANWPGDPEPARQGPPVIPRGLRAFRDDDAHFFPDLLPGPRDRHGLPGAIRFWKERVEEVDTERTFNVGLLYGPSGCGKSSLVRAGLLPRLHLGIVSACVDAAAEDTGGLVLRALRKQLPNLPPDHGLVETFAAIRRGGGPKVLVVLDQFEQWLHAEGGATASELVDALRQCDGGRLQAIIMVRDDFAMAAARFMAALDIPIVQGHNFATLDLFDVDHARLVLTRFGQAYGRLPTGPPGPSAEQRRFLDAAAVGLARDGRVIPVRLALFAEMVKDRPWAPAALEEAGGTEGIGVNFLEETFRSRAGNPAHQLLEGPARRVLKALLPGVGSDIKGNLRSTAELREAAGLGDRPTEFATLLRVLDGELRLLTPTDPPVARAEAVAEPGAQYWQLTHDYLVPSLRAWLGRKQRETRRGRAELRLEERGASWAARGERRQLPTLWEWISIRALTDPRRWGGAERAMMHRAGRLHGFRLAAAGALAVGLVAANFALAGRDAGLRRRARAENLVDQILVADFAEVPELAEALGPERALAEPRLRRIADDPDSTRKERLRAWCALVDGPDDDAARLIELAAAADPRELAAIRRRLAPFARRMAGPLRAAAGRKAALPAAQLRVAALLAGSRDEGEADGAAWDELARPVVTTLLTLETLDLDALAELLRPAAPDLTPHLRERFADPSAVPAERVNAARVLARYADAPLLAELLLEANASQFSMLFPATRQHRKASLTAGHAALGCWTAAGDGDDRPRLARRALNAAILLLRLGRPDAVEGLLAVSGDPTVRTMVILEMRNFGVTPDLPIELLDRWINPAARQALILALGSFNDREWLPGVRPALRDRLARLIRAGEQQAERGAAEWLLQSWGDPLATELEPHPDPAMAAVRVRTPTPPAGRNWWVTSQGQTMVVVDGGAGDAAGGPGGRFAVSSHEVTVEQYRRFKPDAKFLAQPAEERTVPIDERFPATKVSYKDAMEYCRWLSTNEGVPEDQMCYPPPGETAPGEGQLAEDRHARTGYRLPTEAEWERAAQAGTTTPWFSGTMIEHLPRFVWYAENSQNRLNRVASLRPNPLGIFDVLGNASEWTHPKSAEIRRKGSGVLVGGYYANPPLVLYPWRYDLPAASALSFTGFRVARTIEPSPSHEADR